MKFLFEPWCAAIDRVRGHPRRLLFLLTSKGNLIALGADCFLSRLPEGDFRSGIFFGSSQQGQAENLIAPYFAARRVSH